MSGVNVEIEGLEKTIKRLDGKPLLGAPLTSFFKKVSITIQGFARENAPVDTGKLRSSIAYEIDDNDPPTWATIGPNQRDYARPMEFGTGLLSDSSESSHQRHFPPGPALDVWASRHGFESGWAVAKIIARRGGLRPRKYMRTAAEQSVAGIRGFVDDLGNEIRRIWESSR